MSGLMKVSSNPHIRDKASTDKIMGAQLERCVSASGRR